MAYTGYADMTDDQIADAIADLSAEQTLRTITSAASGTLMRVQAYIDARPELGAFGIVASQDTQDGAWVRLRFPFLVEEDQYKKALQIGAVQMIVENYGGKLIDVETVRQREDTVYLHLDLLNQVLNA